MHPGRALPWTLLLAVLGPGLSHALDVPDKKLASLEGVVLLEGTRPEPKVLFMRDLDRLLGGKPFLEQTWLVGKNNGLANCVVTLREVDPASRVSTKPVDKLLLEKKGAIYSPRVVVGTPGSKMVLRNVDSRCQEIMGSAVSWTFSYHIPAGKEQTIILPQPGAIRCHCGVHVNLDCWLVVVDTPYFAVTDVDGNFSFPQLPDGAYTLSLWHEAAGKRTVFAGPKEIKIKEGKAERIELRVAPPTSEQPQK